MKAIAYFIMLFFLVNQINAQKEGDEWVIGYYSQGNPEYSIMNLDFSGNEMKIEWHFDENMLISETCSNICDQAGQPILWTNGMQIFGKHGVTVDDKIAFDAASGYWSLFDLGQDGILGFPELDGTIILPVPEKLNEFSVLYHSAIPDAEHGFIINKILECRVKMNQDSTFTVLYKDSLIGPVLNWYTGPILSCKHANGRDWWIVLFQGDSPNYFVYILEPSGIRLYNQGSTNLSIDDGEGQAAFSGLGNFVVRMDASSEDGSQITLFSFNRCSGQLELLETLHETFGFFTGAAFSPSERYLYADDNTHLWQWDLWSNDIPNSQKLVDTFDGFVQPGWFPMIFGPMKLAPDGRIYVIPATGSSEFMHVINRPDLAFNECDFKQHSINLKVPNGRSAPNLPNFKLGPLDGSECDTLDINNLAKAKFRYTVESDNQTVWFTDLSYFNPATWHWQFDDGNTIDLQNPIHFFEPGLYDVCLTVSNQYGNDSFCQSIEIKPNSINEGLYDDHAISISPNPFSKFIEIRNKDGAFQEVEVKLFDINGKLILYQPKIIIPSQIYFPDFPVGLYILSVINSNGTQFNFKIIKE